MVDYIYLNIDVNGGALIHSEHHIILQYCLNSCYAFCTLRLKIAGVVERNMPSVLKSLSMRIMYSNTSLARLLVPVICCVTPSNRTRHQVMVQMPEVAVSLPRLSPQWHLCLYAPPTLHVVGLLDSADSGSLFHWLYYLHVRLSCVLPASARIALNSDRCTSELSFYAPASASAVPGQDLRQLAVT